MEIMENISKLQAFSSEFKETPLCFPAATIADAKNTLLTRILEIYTTSEIGSTALKAN
jgi:hypothetical protein